MNLLNSTHMKTLIKIGKWLYWIALMQEFVFHSKRYTLLWYNFSGSVCLQLWGSLDSSHISVCWSLSNQHKFMSCMPLCSVIHSLIMHSMKKHLFSCFRVAAS